MEIFGGFLEAFWSGFVPVIHAFQIQPIGVRIHLSPRDGMVLSQVSLDSYRDSACHVILQGKNVAKVPLVAFCPEMLVATGFNQSPPDPPPTPRSEHTSLHHRVVTP